MLRVLIVAALRHLAALSCPSVTLRYFLLLCCAACHFMFPVFASVMAVKLFFILTSLFFYSAFLLQNIDRMVFTEIPAARLSYII
jgi:hypothetical protein